MSVHFCLDDWSKKLKMPNEDCFQGIYRNYNFDKEQIRYPSIYRIINNHSIYSIKKPLPELKWFYIYD